MMDDLMVPLSMLVLDLDTSAAELAERLGDRVLTDDLGRPAIDRSVARWLIGEHHAAQDAAQAAAAQRAEAERAEREHRAADDQAEQAARQARADRQRQLLADNPGLDAVTLMKLTDSDHDRQMAAAGSTFDGYLSAERQGHLGFGYRLRPTPTEE